VKFDLLLMLGRVQRHLGQYASAEPLLKEALSIADANFTPDSIPRLQAHTEWAEVLNEQSHIAQSAQELDAAIAMHRHAGAVESDALVAALMVLGTEYSNLEQFDRAIATSRQALDMARRLHGQRDPVVQRALGNLGEMLMRAGRLGEAETTSRANVVLSRELYGEHNAKYANSLTVLADALSQQNKDAESERLARQALAIEESVYDRPNAALIGTLSALTDSLYDQDKLDETQSTLQRWLVAQTQLTGSDDPSLTPILFNLGVIAKRRHQYPQAEHFMRQALAIFGKRPGSVPSTQESDTWRSLAEILVSQQRPLEAIAAVQEALAIDRHAHGSDDQRVGMDLLELARADTRLGHLTPALEQVEQALGILGKSSRTENRDLNDDLNDARVLKAAVLNRLARGQEAKDLLLPMIPHLRQAGSENADHDRLSRALAELGRAQSGSGETRDALASWDEALALQQAIQPPDTEAMTELHGLIAQARKTPQNLK
jgi:tetratricopeptide (TPR) repeat protein